MKKLAFELHYRFISNYETKYNKMYASTNPVIRFRILCLFSMCFNQIVSILLVNVFVFVFVVAPAPTVTVEATSETVTVRWDAASPAHLNGDVQGYQLRYTRTKPEPLDTVLVDVMCNEYVITEGATGDSEFEIEVKFLRVVSK